MQHKLKLSLLLFLAACATEEQRPLPPLMVNAGSGVEITRTELLGHSGALTTSGLLDDCAGPGLGVKVNGTTQDEHFLFDVNGNPCESSTEIFNGSDAAHQRPTDATSVQVNFKDAFGSVSPQLTGTATELEPIDMRMSGVQTGSILPEDHALIAAEAPNLNNVNMLDENPDTPLAATIAAWDTAREQQRMETERRLLLDKSAQTLSSMRELDRLTSRELIAAQHDKMLELMSRLRETERQLHLEQQSHQNTLAAADKTRDVAEAKITSWQQKEDQLNAEMSELQARLGAFESLSQRLAQEKRTKETIYQERVQTLEEQLKHAEGEANKVRKELVLEAAQKIAEAERIAFAARLAEQEAKKLEAERLKVEGNQLMARANALNSANSVVVPRLANMFDPLMAKPNTPQPTPLMPLEDVPLTINVMDQPLNQIVEDIFQNVRTVSGTWQVQWQLSGTAQYLLEETWTLTAEARFKELMAHIKHKVQQENGIALKFKRFDQTRLFVITDE